MATISQTGFPPYFINAYIVGQLKQFGILTGAEQFSPIIPVTATNIDTLYSNYIGSPGEDAPLMIVYDRLLRFRPNTFYRHKREQLIYTIHSSEQSKVYDAHRIISEALDREDASGQDVNLWVSKNPILDEAGNAIEPNVFFHNFKVYQADETRDLLELSSVRTIYRNKLIIEYDYHTNNAYYD